MLHTGDITPPAIFNCPEDITETVSDPGNFYSVTWVEPTATDESGPTTVTSTRVPGSYFDVGETSDVKYTFKDEAGNEAECVFSITVVRK